MVLWCMELERSGEVNKPGRGFEAEDQFPDLLQTMCVLKPVPQFTFAVSFQFRF